MESFGLSYFNCYNIALHHTPFYVIFYAMKKMYIGDILVADGSITKEQLNDALKKQENYPHLKLGDLMVLMGFLTAQKLKYALQKQSEAANGKSSDSQTRSIEKEEIKELQETQNALIELLVSKNLITKDELMNAVNKSLM